MGEACGDTFEVDLIDAPKKLADFFLVMFSGQLSASGQTDE